MAENRNLSRLSYLDAGDISDDRVDFDGLDVLDPAGRKLGDVDGFIVQRDTNRPYYVVVDSGGWFSSRSFLVPIGHARLDAGNKALRVDLDKATIERFPEFDEDRFPEMSEDEARLFNERTLNACCATELQGRTGADRYDYDKWSHYAQPDWWPGSGFAAASRERRDLAARGTRDVNYEVPPPSAPLPPREQVTARERDIGGRDIDVVPTDREVRDERIVRDRVTETDRVDALDRAQPGDVLGIEHAGETTALGDTSRDERERLEHEEEDAAKLRERDVKDKKR